MVKVDSCCRCNVRHFLQYFESSKRRSSVHGACSCSGLRVEQGQIFQNGESGADANAGDRRLRSGRGAGGLDPVPPSKATAEPLAYTSPGAPVLCPRSALHAAFLSCRQSSGFQQRQLQWELRHDCDSMTDGNRGLDRGSRRGSTKYDGPSSVTRSISARSLTGQKVVGRSSRVELHSVHHLPIGACPDRKGDATRDLRSLENL